MVNGSEARLTPVSDPIGTHERPLLVVVVGPTAVGKTAAAIQIASALQTEIVNADSRQVYRKMALGTAQPDAQERAAIPHHFIDFVDPSHLYSAGQFEAHALAWLNHWFLHHRTAVLSGGSGLYVKAVLEGLDEMPADLEIRSQLNHRLQAEGLESLANELEKLDPVSARRMDLCNPQRVIRALEVCLASGEPLSNFHQHAPQQRAFDTWVIGLKRDRTQLNQRINARVLQMIDDGLEAEVAALQPMRTENALQTVGFQEWNAYFDGLASRESVIEEIQLRTRQFAKRQMTWFQKMPGIQWFDAEHTENILAALEVECAKRQWSIPLLNGTLKS